MTIEEQDEKEFEEWWIHRFDAPEGVKKSFGYKQQYFFCKETWLASRRTLREKEGR